MLVLLLREIYDVRRLNRLRWQNIHTKNYVTFISGIEVTSHFLPQQF
jgi:hypothetical protein